MEDNSLRIIQNTYPRHKLAPFGEVGDVVHWEAFHGNYHLTRDSDNETLFMIGPIDRNGLMYSTKQPPQLTGIIGQVKSKGWIMEVSRGLSKKHYN
jgi:hypothetical protein